MADLRYPIGPYEPGPAPGSDARNALLSQLEDTPRRLWDAVEFLTETQLDTPYRPGGWTVRQVVHHLTDAQTHWYLRTKMALAEDDPVVKVWDENTWAELRDARTGAVEPSLLMFDGVHRRWVELYRSLTEEQWKRRMIHPERGVLVLDAVLPMFVWHGRHHTAHIVALGDRLKVAGSD
jgi:uncharacterized damage-inducible protein DinB